MARIEKKKEEENLNCIMQVGGWSIEWIQANTEENKKLKSKLSNKVLFLEYMYISLCKCYGVKVKGCNEF